jgi:hypothetical protein
VLRSVYYLPKRSQAWDVLFDPQSSSSSSLIPSPTRGLRLLDVESNLNIFSVAYPKMREAFKIKLPLAMSKQVHPNLTPNNKLVWTQRQRAIISSILESPSRQVKTFEELDQLVRKYPFLFA